MEGGAPTSALPNGRTPCCLLRGQAAVDYHSRPGHEARVVGRQEHDAERYVLGNAEPPDRMLLDRHTPGTLDVVAAGLPSPRNERLGAHVSVYDARMDRVDANLPALAAEGQGRRLGEQRHAALGHGVKRVELRADDAGDRRKVHDRRAVPA